MATKKKPVAPEVPKPAPSVAPPSERVVDVARRLALLGIGPKKTAFALGVTPEVVEEWIKWFPEFALAVSHGRLMADAEVANSLYRNATGYTYEEEVAVKVKTGQYTEAVEIVKLTKEKAPDTNAAMFWLINRHPDKWRKTPVYEGDQEQLPREITIRFVQPKPQDLHRGPTIELTARGHADD